MVKLQEISKKCLQALDAIEAAEIASLSWGYVHASLTYDEVEKLLQKEIGSDFDIDDLLDELLDARLIFSFENGSGDERFRSRFCEILRLSVSNRQQFGWRDWQIAPQLVADYRIDRRKRTFPKRNVDLNELFNLDTLADNAFAQEALKDLLWDPQNQKCFELAGFQKRSLDKILASEGEVGVVVTAGTGSGKTLSFYLPALIEISKLVDDYNWVKALAVYPRTELLKDQFMEAYKLARKMDNHQRKIGRRKIRIGAYFGSTPINARQVPKAWKSLGDGYLCPWLTCPECDNKLIWKKHDQSAGVEKLTCIGENCRFETDQDEIVLTRDAMQDRVNCKPDILFTTTETLNKRIGDMWTRRVFGIGNEYQRRPRFLLLDEVHTYESVTGAQNALTLRRWKHAIGPSEKFCWVGLSATLENATEFFASITNLDVSRVHNEKPIIDDGEFEEEGAEYQILLKGDPTVKLALTSTAIQTCMLVPRMLDNPEELDSPQSMGLFGKKLFVFADNLDVINRLYDDFRNAEAYDNYGNPEPNRIPLSALRSTRAVQGQVNVRDLHGQYWRSSEQLGYDLTDRMKVGRTTSIDGGVMTNANVIVATAALEVGFNDPEVGATLQYKAPRGFASYLQRKGRAGRKRTMRPISLTILSDYGRDRLAFQNYERLFDPYLGAQSLPVNNSYVLKIQAVYAFFDWLAKILSDGNVRGNLDIWKVLSGPYLGSEKDEEAVNLLKKTIFNLNLCKEREVSELSQYLVDALGVKTSEVEKLLWENPRSLMLEVIPTIVRRWYKGWKIAFPENNSTHELKINRHPVPEFIPHSLFSELSLPEVSIEIPAGDVNDQVRHESMPIAQALTEFTPGRVSRRFAERRGRLSHWLPIDCDLPVQTISMSQLAVSRDYVGTFQASINIGEIGDHLKVYRPWQFQLEVVPQRVSTSSNSKLNWNTNIEAQGGAFKIPVPQKSQWGEFIKGVEFYLHRQRGRACVRRFAGSADATIKVNKVEKQISIDFIDEENNPTAIGFELEVDAIKFVIDRKKIQQSSVDSLDNSIVSQLKHQFAFEAFLEDPNLPNELNVFQREWLFQVMATLVALKKYTGNFDANLLKENDYKEFRKELARIINDWFVDPAVSAELNSDNTDFSESSDLNDEHNGQVTLQRVLIDRLENKETCEALYNSCRVLVASDHSGFADWISKVSLRTMGETILQACVSTLPSHATSEDLILDVDLSDDTKVTYWVSETTIGGAGVIEHLAYTIAEYPIRLFEALDAVITISEMEQVDGTLLNLLKLSRDNADISALLKELRNCDNLGERQVIWQKFTKKFSVISNKFIDKVSAISINSRLLRPGSNEFLDHLYLKLLEFREELESASGFIIPNREFAYIASQNEQITNLLTQHLSRTMGPQEALTVSKIASIEGLLWARDFEVRRSELKSYNPYRKVTFIDPIIIRKLFNQKHLVEIPFSKEAMETVVPEQLREKGIAKLVFQVEETQNLKKGLAKFLATPIDIGIFQFYPSIDYISETDQLLCAVLVLKEQIS